MYGLADHRAATLQLYVYMYRLHCTSASMRDYAALTLLSLPLALLEVCQVVVRISVALWVKSDSIVNRIDKSASAAARPTQALGAHCLACEKGALANDSGTLFVMLSLLPVFLWAGAGLSKQVRR